MENKLVIVSVPSKEKHYLIRTNDQEELTLIGDVCIGGSIIGISDTYSESLNLYKNFIGNK